MATINERLAALEATVTGLTGGTAVSSGTGTVSTIYVESSQDAAQNSRLATLESQA